MSTISTNPNTDQITFWNGRSGERWVRCQEIQDRMLRPHGERAIQAAELGAGDRVIDVGCGCGDSTLEIARIVGPAGEVLGIDVSETMVTRAREQAASWPDLRVRFVLADAQAYHFAEGEADAVYSRFGVMFFDDPVAALRNLASALRPGGGLAFACWQRLEDNPWVATVFEIAARHVEIPLPAHGGVGPFAFAEADRIEHILREAGFDGIDIEAYRPMVVMGETLPEAVNHAMQMTPAADTLAAAKPAVQNAIAEELGTAFAPLAAPGGIRIASAGWIVTARRP